MQFMLEVQETNQRGSQEHSFHGADKAINSEGTEVRKMQNMSVRRVSRLKTLVQKETINNERAPKDYFSVSK